MDIFNYYGLIILIIMMIPNIISGIKQKENFINLYHNRVIETLEQIGRFSCFALMIINIPYTYFNFFFDNALYVYLGVNGLLLIIYILGWIITWNKYPLLKAYLLSMVPSLIFIFSGIMLLNIPLIVCAMIFALGHITLSVKNAKLKIKITRS